MRDLSYRMTGDGPPLVLLHPVGLDASFWGDLPDAMSPSHTVVAVDIAGHGLSPDVTRPGRISDYAADIMWLIAYLGRGPVTLLGVSFGGMIAQHVALSRPDLVTRLILAGCPGATPESAKDAILKRGTDAERDGMNAVVPATLERWFLTEFLSTEVVESVRSRLLANSPSSWAAAWEAVAEHDALDRLPALRIPTLVVAGEKDLATPLEAKRALAAAIPGSSLIILPGAPHMMQLECAGPFLDAVLRFLGLWGNA